jgi:hypothetical protein
MVELPADQVVDALFPVILADIAVDSHEEKADAAGVADVRRHRAMEWAIAEYTDPARVRAWIAAGVVDPWVARRAERLGYRPGDPWVPTGWVHSLEWSDRQARAEPQAGRLRAMRNRRRAKRRWKAEQEAQEWLHANAEQQTESAMLMLREVTVPRSGSGSSLVALDLAAGAALDVDSSLVVGALVNLVGRAGEVRELGERVLGRLRDPDTAQWLEREVAARGLPVQDTIALESYRDPTQWLRREADSWCGYVDNLNSFMTQVREQLHLLTEGERRIAEQHLATAQVDSLAARAAWQEVSDSSC